MNANNEDKNYLDFYKKILKSINSAEEPNTYLSNLFLYLLSHLQEAFYQKYEKDFYEIYADIISFIKNPNCSCRTKIIHYVDENQQQIKDIILNWLSTTEFNSSDENKIIKILNKINIEIASHQTYLRYKGEPSNDAVGHSMIGKVVKIDNTPEAYNHFINHLHLNHFYYNGLSMLEEQDKLKIYFY
jgi:predicted transcriptional regulator